MNEHSSRSHVLVRFTFKRGFVSGSEQGQGDDEDKWENDEKVPIRQVRDMAYTGYNKNKI